MDDKALIDKLGGAAQVARLLGYGNGGVQRVHNWLTRGIPAKVKLERPDLFIPSKRKEKAEAFDIQRETALRIEQALKREGPSSNRESR